MKSQPTISVKEYALIVGVHRTTAYEHAESGALPTIRVGRTIRVPSSFVLRQLGLDPAGA
ncbi:helix-turn-helix domain-containing protein [Gordonia amicalis]|uniref:helix-turn-helix domain-containing protein n=1 Tax=Gordonia amicalis TaxID=89053 RepID=UPI00295567D8|nr:helix-turn-helix domain-containing protein [Gordonia amicalis]MDV7099706.1 helix-turn-helix domain-containing protein [Gordonia amicalis]